MIRTWIGIALLAISWLLGLGYFHFADWTMWLTCIVLGVAALGPLIANIPTKEGWAALALLAPAALIAPWPYEMPVLLMMLGIAALVVPQSPRPVRWIGSAMLGAGVILLAQGLTLLGYEIITARSHELPAPLPELIAGWARVMDIDAGASGSTVTVGSMRKTQPMGATWELLIDPATVAFLVGGAVALWLKCRQLGSKRWRDWARAFGLLLLAVALWAPIRIALLLGLMLHRTLLTEYEETLIVLNQFVNTWLHLALMGGAVWLAWRFVRLPPRVSVAQEPSQPPVPRWRPFGVAGLVGLGVLLMSLALFWDPVGVRKPGRVLVDEFHSTWEPTGRPMDTEWYGQSSGYNYACVYDYLDHFYQMGRITKPIDSDTLRDCDVLILKNPTSSYDPAELDYMEQFVRRGGGVLLVGEHTDVFGTGRNINDLARRFDFEFRYDCLFGIDSVFDDHFEPPLVPHPAIQAMGPMEFAVSCSIQPHGEGRAVIRGVGLKSMPADYHASNFYPQVEDRAESRYGAFVQSWSTRGDRGRVVGFADSTIWSNFCAFEPGKIELLTGLVEWLNHRNGMPDPRWWLVGLGGLSVIAGAVLKRGSNIGWLGLLASGVFAWSVTTTLVRAAQQYAMPLPNVHRPMIMVAMDQSACSVKLPKDGFIAGKAGEFGIFERWILRLGYFTCRRSGTDAFDANMVVYAYPDKPVPQKYAEQLREYVRGGGHVLVIDSTKNRDSTANTLLYPFGISIRHTAAFEGALESKNLPSVPVTDACEVLGGEVMSQVKETPVAAHVSFGKGSVTAIGYGERFTDPSMGVTGDIQPDAAMRKIYELQFQVLRHILEPNRPPATTQTQPSEPATTPPQPGEQMPR